MLKMHAGGQAVRKISGFLKITSVSWGRVVTQTEQFFDGHQSDRGKSYTSKEQIALSGFFPDFFPHLRIGKSAKNVMRAGDANRTIFRWPPNLKITTLIKSI